MRYAKVLTGLALVKYMEISMVYRQLVPMAALLAWAGLVVSPACAGTGEPSDTQKIVATYADVVALTESAPLVVQVEVKKAIKLDPPRQVGVADGMVRAYVEAAVVNVFAGRAPAFPVLRYVVDVPADAKGHLPNLKKQQFIAFARQVGNSPDEIQLVSPDGHWSYNAQDDARLRGVLAELTRPDAPPRVTGVNMALYQPGTLAGEGETQLFLTTSNAAPATITMQHAPGKPMTWSISFSEVVSANTRPPARDTLTWYRLACFLPRGLPAAANTAGSPDERLQAATDYALLLRDLGPCEHKLKTS